MPKPTDDNDDVYGKAGPLILAMEIGSRRSVDVAVSPKVPLPESISNLSVFILVHLSDDDQDEVKSTTSTIV